MKKIKRAFLVTAAMSTFAVASPATAAVIIEQKASFVQPDENVQLDIDQIAGDREIRGTTNQTGSIVLFESMTDALVSGPQGQATITATTPNSTTTPVGAGVADGLNNLVFSLENFATFTEAEFNITASVAGMVRISVFDLAGMIISNVDATVSAGGEVGEIFDLRRNASNFFGVVADSSSPIGSIEIQSLGATRISSIGQFRVGGINGVGAVPEPTTWMLMLLGMAGIGFSMRRKTSSTPRVRFA